MSCLAGIGAQIPTIVETARAARKLAVIDGCPVACGKKSAEMAGIEIEDHIIITKLGIQKSYDLEVDGGAVQPLADMIRSSLVSSGDLNSKDQNALINIDG